MFNYVSNIWPKHFAKCLLMAATSFAFSSSLVAAPKYKVGDKVDVPYGDKFYRSTVKSINDTCINVTYDDGTKESIAKEKVAAFGTHTDGEPKSASLKIAAGEKVDLMWTDNAWYKGKIDTVGVCYTVEYIGWNGDTGVFPESDVHPFGSKAKGDTSAKAMGASSGGGGASAAPAKMTSEQKANCSAAIHDRNKCMRYPYCEWKDRCTNKYE